MIPTETSEQVRDALDKVLQELPAARVAYEQAEDKRDDLVLDGTDAERDAAEAEAVRLERVWRDLDVARSKLATRLEVAQKQENLDAMRALANEATAQVDRQVEILGQVAKMTAKLIALAEEFQASTKKVATIRQMLTDAKAADLLPGTILHRARDAGWTDNHPAYPPIGSPRAFPEAFLGEPGVHHRMLLQFAKALTK